MSTITQVVDQQLDSAGLMSYRGRAAGVVQALEERETNAVQALIDFAVEAGLSREQAREAISEAGLHVPVEVAASTPDSGSDDDRLARMERNIETLMNVARQRGLL